jgi:uncharacterized membrane protein
MLQDVHGGEQDMWFHKEEKGQTASSIKCDKVRAVIGVIVVIILFIIAFLMHRNLITGITALIAGIIIGMFLGEKCALKTCKP